MTQKPDAYEPNMVLATKQFRVLGTRPVRHDGADKVTGRALYGADVQLSGLIHGAVLRSPHAHARIRSIDTSAAEAMEGVLAVVTAADLGESGDRMVDLGEGEQKLSFMRGNVLASGKVLYKGHAVAGVAAVSLHVAQEAAAKIKVEYEPLPAVTTTQQAMAEGAPILHESLRTKELASRPTARAISPSTSATTRATSTLVSPKRT
jgi:xanthine dehydrogenase molybdenum-binding subunit